MNAKRYKDLRNDSSWSVGFISLGCAKNLVDSQRMAGVLLSEKIPLARAPEEADVVIVNTCAFIQDARDESLEAIRDACRLKVAGGPCKAVLVAGCFPQRYQSKVTALVPEVDAWIGLDEIEKVGAIVRGLAAGERGVLDVSSRSVRLFEPRHSEPVFTGGPFAYLKVAEGCGHACAFCAIPAIRGKQRSRSPDSVVQEARRLLDIGIRELNLISQDTFSYGRDLGEHINLPHLLRLLSELPGKFWVRVLYGYPSVRLAAILDAMKDHPKICRYLDIPIQHSHPDILRAMGRAGTVAMVDGMADRLRQAIPDIALRTTCLVGFPGETDEHFEHLLEYVKRSKFDHLGAFVFSPEQNTRALGLRDRPAPKIAEERRHRLLLAQRGIVDRNAASRLGTAVEVLLEKPAPGRRDVWIGRSRRQAPEVDGEVLVERLRPRQRTPSFLHARYIAQDDYDMTAAAISGVDE